MTILRTRAYRKLAFVGESSADLAQADLTQMTPPGRGADFATGGCYGKAAAGTHSVWDLRRKLGNDYDAMRRGLSSSPEFQETRERFSECVLDAGGVKVTSPGELERLASDGTMVATKASETTGECMPIWDEGQRSIEITASGEFLHKHLKELEATAARYEGSMDRIRRDDTFLTYLADELIHVEAVRP